MAEDMFRDEPVAYASHPEFSQRVLFKLNIVKDELGSENLEAALDKSLNIAHFVAETLADSQSKLLIKHRGEYQEVKGF